MEGSAPVALKEQVFVYYNYHSVPIPTEKINSLVKHITNELDLDYERFFVCCDVRTAPQDFVDAVELIPKAELCHMSATAVETSICERVKWHSNVFKATNPVAVLISGSGSFGSTLNQLSRVGWKVIIFHPPNTATSFLDYADLAIPLPVYRGWFDASGLEKHENSIFGIPATNDLLPLQDNMEVGQGFSELLDRISIKMGSPSTYKYKMFASEESKKPNVKPNPLFVTDRTHENAIPVTNLSYAKVTSGFGSKVVNEVAIMPEMPLPFYTTPPPPLVPQHTWNVAPMMQNEPTVMPPKATVTQEKKNPFQQKNPFAKQNPFVVHEAAVPVTNRWSAMQEKTCSNGITGGKRNPFGGNCTKAKKEVFVKKDRMPIQVAASAGSKFRKPAQQCPLWEEKEHRQLGICTLWHPNKSCMYFPHCSAGAIECGYSHPFCAENGCVCPQNNKNPQVNHDVQVRFMHKEEQI